MNSLFFNESSITLQRYTMLKGVKSSESKISKCDKNLINSLLISKQLIKGAFFLRLTAFQKRQYFRYFNKSSTLMKSLRFPDGFLSYHSPNRFRCF